MNVLVITGDYWHPAEVVRRGLTLAADGGVEFDFVTTAKDIVSHELLKRYPLVILAKSDVHSEANHEHPWFEDGITLVTPENYVRYVENGGGLIALHAGLVLSRREEFASLFRASFLGHPPQCAVNVEVTNQHPVTAGVSNFEVRDEHYQLAITGEVTPLFDTRSRAGGVCSGGFVREVGKGRFCALSPGHNLWVYENTEFQKLIRNAINWCAKK